MRVPTVVPGEGFGVGFKGVVGARFPVKIRESGKGVGGGWGARTGKRTGKSMRKLCRNYSLANYPLVSPRFFKLHRKQFIEKRPFTVGDKIITYRCFLGGWECDFRSR